MGEIAHNPWAEVAWYFPDTREQFRLLGKLSVVNAATADEKLQKVGCSHVVVQLVVQLSQGGACAGEAERGGRCHRR